MLEALFGVENNCILDLSGRVSQLYKKKAFDLEGLSELDVDDILRKESALLGKLSECKVFISCDNGLINTFEDELLSLKPLNFEQLIGTSEGKEIKVYQNYFLYKERFYRVYDLKGFSCDINPALIHSVLDNSSFALFKAQKIDLSASKSLLEKKRRILFSKLLHPFKDPKSEEDYEELEELLGLVDQQETSLFKFEGSFIVRGLSLEELSKHGEKLVNRAKSKNLELSISLENPREMLVQYFPGTKIRFRRALNITLQSLTNLILIKKDLVHKSGIAFSSDTGNEIFFNPFDTHSENYNMVISGPSGRGKSVLANKLIFELYREGKSIVIIDKGASFKKSCLYFEGIEITDLNALDSLAKNTKQSLVYLDIDNFRVNQRREVIEAVFKAFKELEGEKILVIDECWEFLKGHEDFLEESFRTFRKMRASALAISQSLEDFEQSLLGRVILDNSAHKLLFKQEVHESKYLNRLQLESLSKCNGIKGEFTEILYLSDQKTKKLRYTQSKLEAILFNTEKEKNCRFFNFYRENKAFYKFSEIAERYIC